MHGSKQTTFSIILLLIPLLCGCRITFRGESVIREDGTLERTTTFKTQDQSDIEELLTRYEIPEGGMWSDRTPKIESEQVSLPAENKRSAYKVKKVYSPSQLPQTDFKRFTKVKDKWASNEFSVQVKDWWLFKKFNYTESFHDILDHQNLPPLIDDVLKKSLNVFREELKVAGVDPERLEEIINLLKNKFQPLFLNAIQSMKEDNSALDSKEWEQLQEEFEAQKTLELVVSQFPEFNTPERKELILQAFQAAEAQVEQSLEPLEEIIFGVHGLALFQNYEFQIQVTLPGKIQLSNATEQEGNTLTWKFDSSQLDQKMQGQSQLIYPVRILIGVIILLLVISFLLIALLKIGKKK